MDLIFGDVRILYISDGGIYKPVACLTSNPMEEEVEMLDTTTVAQNGWRTSIPTNQGYTISFEGMQIVTGEGGDEARLSYDSLKLIKRLRQRIDWRIEDDNGRFIDEGQGYITSIGESNQVGELLTFNGEILGYGEPTFSRLKGDLWMNGEEKLFQDGTAMIYQ